MNWNGWLLDIFGTHIVSIFWRGIFRWCCGWTMMPIPDGNAFHMTTQWRKLWISIRWDFDLEVTGSVLLWIRARILARAAEHERAVWRGEFEKEAVSQTFDVECWGKQGCLHMRGFLSDVIGCHIWSCLACPCFAAVCCMLSWRTRNNNTPMMTLNLFNFEKNFEFLMKEHESLRGIKQNNLTHRLAWSGT